MNAPLYSSAFPPDVRAALPAYLARLTDAQLEQLARGTPEENAKRLGIKVIGGLNGEGDETLGWIQLVAMAASAIIGAKKAKDKKKKLKKQQEQEAAQARAQAAAESAALAKAAKERDALPSASESKAKMTKNVLLIGGGLALFAGTVYILTRK